MNIIGKETLIMKVIEKLNITPEELYSVMMDSLIQDYKSATKKEIQLEDIHTGFVYKKKSRKRMGFSSTMRVEILELEKNRKYSVMFTTKIEQSISTYEIMPKGKKNCIVTYTEEFSSAVEDGKKLIRNDEDKAKQNLRRTLHEVERQIINHRRKDIK